MVNPMGIVNKCLRRMSLSPAKDTFSKNMANPANIVNPVTYSTKQEFLDKNPRPVPSPVKGNPNLPPQYRIGLPRDPSLPPVKTKPNLPPRYEIGLPRDPSLPPVKTKPNLPPQYRIGLPRDPSLPPIKGNPKLPPKYGINPPKQTLPRKGIPILLPPIYRVLPFENSVTTARVSKYKRI